MKRELWVPGVSFSSRLGLVGPSEEPEEEEEEGGERHASFSLAGWDRNVG